VQPTPTAILATEAVNHHWVLWLSLTVAMQVVAAHRRQVQPPLALGQVSLSTAVMLRLLPGLEVQACLVLAQTRIRVAAVLVAVSKQTTTKPILAVLAGSGLPTRRLSLLPQVGIM
jgi:hypothetical protein